MGGTAAELRWAAGVDRFAAGLLPVLRRLEGLTGGGGNAGVVGTRLDPGIFRAGPKRRLFSETMSALASCPVALAATGPRPPTERLSSVRASLVHACEELASVPLLMRDDVLAAKGPAGVPPGALREATGRAQEGVRALGGALRTMRTIVATAP